jgi:tRNA threonylcarbamoyl adenosine modification protein YeaZ
MIAELLDGRVPAAIVVDCGPGSFTGLRVGLAAAHGLAIGWAVPLHGYSSLAAIAAAVPGPELAVALHGGHGQLFVQTYARDPLRPLDPLRSITPAEAAAVISADLVAGSGAGDLVEARGFGEARDLLPRAADVRLLPSELRSLAPRPIYGRAPDAKPMAE